MGEKPKGFNGFMVILVVVLIIQLFTVGSGIIGSTIGTIDLESVTYDENGVATYGTTGSSGNILADNLFSIILFVAFLIGLIGVYKLKKWAWIIVLIVAVLQILITLRDMWTGSMLFGVISLIIWGIVLHYLFKMKNSFQ
jgi:lysylphosphatidylglycerol synthetase-like protein (DUF2156 family)